MGPPPGDATAAVVTASGVTCRFGTSEALAEVDLTVGAGEIYALLGPNGAGKTTLLRVLIGLQQPTAGRVRVDGAAPNLWDRGVQHRLGHVPSGSRSFYLRLSGLENLLFFARLHGLSRRAARARAEELLEAVGLEDAARRRVGLYSNGMQRRLALARAVLHRPALLAVDEATHDLDPEGARRIRTLVREEARRGAAVVWATQRLEEIRSFADRVTVLHRGRVRFAGTVPELMATVRTQRYLLRLRNGGAPGGLLLETVRGQIGARGTVAATGDGEHYLLALEDHVILGEVVADLTAAGVAVLACREEQSLIEAALLGLTSEHPRRQEAVR